EDMDALGRARPDAAVDVETEAVEEPGGAGGEDLAAGEGAIGVDPEAPDVARAVRAVGGAGVGDIEETLVRREGETVRAHEVAGHDAHVACRRIDAIDITSIDFHRRPMTLV